VTRDGGVSWQSQTLIGNRAGFPEQVMFFDHKNGPVIAQPSRAWQQHLSVRKPSRARHSHGG
jgi:photosystem II stability/assembly factor-like uncharacterized protein